MSQRDDDAGLTVELAFVGWHLSCRDPHVLPGGELRQCRRLVGHCGQHASGFGAGRERW